MVKRGSIHRRGAEGPTVEGLLQEERTKIARPKPPNPHSDQVGCVSSKFHPPFQVKLLISHCQHIPGPPPDRMATIIPSHQPVPEVWFE